MNTIEEYEAAIKVCEGMRGMATNLIKLTPAQLHIYSVFTKAKRDLTSQLAVIEDVLGVYNLKEK